MTKPTKKAWKPELGETYYSTTEFGIEKQYWQDSMYGRKLMSHLLVFRTRALATQASKAIRTLLKTLEHG